MKDYFGGDIYKHNKENHYFNVIDGKVIDLTKDQFDYELDYTDSRKKMPDLNSGKTKERYELLKERLKSSKKQQIDSPKSGILSLRDTTFLLREFLGITLE